MSKRIEYIDTAKGLLIIFVVVGHIFLNGILHNFLYTFHMPAFFIISGMLSNGKDRPLLTTCYKKIFTLIVPFFFFEIIGSFVYIVRFGFNQSIFGFAYNTLTLHCNTGTDWFLVTLFFADILFIVLQKTIKSQVTKIALSLILLLVALFLPNSHSFIIIARILIAVTFLTLGHYSVHYIKNKNIVLTISAFIITIAISFFNGSVDLSEMILNAPLLYFIGSAAGTYFIIQISKNLSKISFLKYFGKNSLIIMGTHQAILLPLRHYMNITEFSIVSGIIALILVVALEFPIIYLFNKFIPFLVGKKISPKSI